jgi:hypothetical protein
MILINFSHRLTNPQIAQLAEILAMTISPPIDRMPQFDSSRPFAEQITELVDSIGLSPSEWQTESILVNPPALAPSCAVLVAELQGRMGYFPTIIRLRSVANYMPPQYEVAEIINLQSLRDHARQRR